MGLTGFCWTPTIKFSTYLIWDNSVYYRRTLPSFLIPQRGFPCSPFPIQSKNICGDETVCFDDLFCVRYVFISSLNRKFKKAIQEWICVGLGALKIMGTKEALTVITILDLSATLKDIHKLNTYMICSHRIRGS